MEQNVTPEQALSLARAVPFEFPASRYWVDYDREAVLYVSFAHRQQAADTDMTDEGFLLRYRDDRIVGVTVLDASARLRRGAS